MAPIAPNTAHVFGHVGPERTLVRHNLVADSAGRLAQVNLIVIVAASSLAVRLVAQAANESPVTFVNLPPLGGHPSLNRLEQRIACKFQVPR
jgi:hypothetical protein